LFGGDFECSQSRNSDQLLRLYQAVETRMVNDPPRAESTSVLFVLKKSYEVPLVLSINRTSLPSANSMP
jgi:hypothetical protein